LIQATRVKEIKRSESVPGAVVYWMSRDQRASDNWALLFASELARQTYSPLIVVFCLAPEFLGACLRQYSFMLGGLVETERILREKGIPFHVLTGEPVFELVEFLDKYKATSVVSDFDPLKIKLGWKSEIIRRININFFEVDTHNIIPCRFVSDKQEYGAYTIRPKIKRLLNDYLTDFPELESQEMKSVMPPPVDWNEIKSQIVVDKSVTEVDWIKPGESAAHDSLNSFIQHKLKAYEIERNDPFRNAQSNLSPYLHFGQISAQRIALEVTKSDANERNKAVFLEELIVRKELSDNFCFYNKNYNSITGFPAWAQNTLEKHYSDKRDYTYSLEQFENAQTHDDLWNAAQNEMVRTGKMHGYMRMYWAKKILEWSCSPEDAIGQPFI
jgi:deoxyribodipyrimidine photo-lyase